MRTKPEIYYLDNGTKVIITFRENKDGSQVAMAKLIRGASNGTA